jgi:hypothetical protein
MPPTPTLVSQARILLSLAQVKEGVTRLEAAIKANNERNATAETKALASELVHLNGLITEVKYI